MLAGAALSETSLGELSVSNINLSAAGNAVAVCSPAGAGSVALSTAANINAASSVFALAHVERDSSSVGTACSATYANAVGRVDFGDTVAVARSRVLPTPTAFSQVLPLVSGALTIVRADRVAQSRVLPLAATATTSASADVRAASRVELER